MDETETKAIIKGWAEELRAKLENGRLYGRPIDMTDPDEVLVASFCMGQTDWYTHHKQPEFP